MKIEELKRWHWTIIGAVVGLLLAWAWTSFSDAGGFGEPGTIGAKDFEAGLASDPQQGRPRIRDVAVYQQEGHEVVRMKVLTADANDPHPYNPRHYHYQPRKLNATSPYIPGLAEDDSQTVTVRVNPSAIDLNPDQIATHDLYPLWINDRVAWRGVSRLGLSGWKVEPGGWSDPGSGSTLSLALRPANYNLLVLLSGTGGAVAVDRALTISLNNHDVAPLVRSPAAAAVWQTRLPREAFVPGEIQTLKFVARGMPVKIREIRLADPNYTVIDYLAYARGKHPGIMYQAAWWDRPLVKYPLWAIVGAMLIGGLWPALLSWMIGRGKAEGKHEETYDLDRFGGKADQSKDPVQNPVPAMDLSQLEEELSRNPKLQPAGADQGEAASSPITPLPAALAPSPPIAGGQSATQEAADFRGEYYPVAHPPEKKTTQS